MKHRRTHIVSSNWQGDKQLSSKGAPSKLTLAKMFTPYCPTDRFSHELNATPMEHQYNRTSRGVNKTIAVEVVREHFTKLFPQMSSQVVGPGKDA